MSYVFFTICLLACGLMGVSASTINASSDPYDSGYDHGCDDAKISDSSDGYVNQPEKGPSFHTETFMQGYYNGYNSCTTNMENIHSPGAGIFRIDATIDFDRQAILEANGNNLGNAWFTINGVRYGEGTYYDMIDWVYDDVEIRGINTNSLSRAIELPYSLQLGQGIQICLTAAENYAKVLA